MTAPTIAPAADPTSAADPDLATFTASLHAAVDRFERKWLEMQKTDPKDWPERRGEADWHEQFITFLLGDE